MAPRAISQITAPTTEKAETMRKHTLTSVLFYAAAAYGGLLGIPFLFFPLAIFTWCKVTPPNHLGYVQFPAALILVFGLMFVNIARNPVRNRGLIWYGILLKLSYCSVVFWHWLFGELPDMWKPLAVIDACFGLLFIWAYIQLGRAESE